MFVYIQVSKTYNRQFIEEEGLSLHIFSASVWSFIDGADILATSNSIMELCQKIPERKPLLLHQYYTFRESLLNFNKEHGSSTDKPSLVIGFEDKKLSELVKMYISKTNKMSLKEKDSFISDFESNNKEINDIENSIQRDASLSSVVAMVGRLITVTSLTINMDVIDLNHSDNDEIKTEIHLGLESAYKLSGMQSLMRKSKSGSQFLSDLVSCDAEVLQDAFTTAKTESEANVKSMIESNSTLNSLAVFSNYKVESNSIH